MLIAIHQPEYLPWAGFFEKVRRAEVFVVLDHVQFSKNDYQNRTRIKAPAGPQWLTVPVAHRFGQSIDEVATGNIKWQEKHWKTLVSCYGRAPFWNDYAGILEEFYRRPWNRLSELNTYAISFVTKALGIDTPVIRSSALQVEGNKSDLVLSICKQLGATAYYSGRTGSSYLDRAEFERAGVRIKVQEFEHPVYKQLFKREDGFIEGLSIVDLLVNCGPESASLIAGQGRAALHP